jgi:hypothetical protein
MARIAFDDRTLYLNGAKRRFEGQERESIASLCSRRRLNRALVSQLGTQCLRWLLAHGAFDLADIG